MVPRVCNFLDRSIIGMAQVPNWIIIKQRMYNNQQMCEDKCGKPFTCTWEPSATGEGCAEIHDFRGLHQYRKRKENNSLKETQFSPVPVNDKCLLQERSYHVKPWARATTRDLQIILRFEFIKAMPCNFLQLDGSWHAFDDVNVEQLESHIIDLTFFKLVQPSIA